MRKFVILLLCFLSLSAFSGFSQEVPDNHPAKQMRMYYADVYTGANILEYKAESLDSILFVVSQFIEPAQVISVYSYKYDPYNFRRKNIYADSKTYPLLHQKSLERTTYAYSGVSGFYLDFPSDQEQPKFRPFTCYNPRRPRQDNSD